MGKQVKVVVSTPTNYRPGVSPPVSPPPLKPPGTPLGAGVPTNAPSQTIAQTGEGPRGEAEHPPQASLAPQPASAATTGPKIASPSVDYNTQQGSRITGKGGPGVDYSGEQQQQLQDKGGA